MDPFLDLYWNLDQIVGWAETRDPEIVRLAMIPKDWRPRRSLNLLAHYPRDALNVLGVGRDVEGELWAASGVKPAVSNFVPALLEVGTSPTELGGLLTRCILRTASLSCDH